jgi:homoserine kinase type II
MQEPTDNIPRLLTRFGLDAAQCQIQPLGNAGGFSGAQLWRIDCGERAFALRQWPAEVEEGRMRYVHAVLAFAGMQVDFVPRLQRTAGDDTLFHLAGRHWELATWRPGAADFRRDPSDERLRAALQALAGLHTGLQHFPTRMTGLGTSPAMQKRQERLIALRDLVPQLRARLAAAEPALIRRGQPIIASFEQDAAQMLSQLRAAATFHVALQPCLRDIWHDHVLFTGSKVTGIIDFGAARVESVAGDIARLVGSLVGDDPARRAFALAAYEDIRPLMPNERSLIPIFDRSSVLMSGMNWLQWLLIDGRQFEDLPRVYERLDEIVERLREVPAGDDQGRCDDRFAAF